MDAGDVHAARLQLDHEEDEVPLEAGQREYVDGEEVGVRQPKGSATTLLPEDAVLLPEIVGQIFLVAVSTRNLRASGMTGGYLRTAARPASLRPFATLGRFFAPYGNDSRAIRGNMVATRSSRSVSCLFVVTYWSGLRGSNPCPRLGKPLYYHCTKPARRLRISGFPTFTFAPSISRTNQSDHFVALLLHQRPRLRLQVRPEQWFRVRRPHVEVPVGKLDRNAIELVLMAV